MKTSPVQLLLCVLLVMTAGVGAFRSDAIAQENTRSEQQPPPRNDAPQTIELERESAADEPTTPVRRHGHRHSDNVIFHMGRDSLLPAGESADAVVSILGSSTSEGEVDEAVVSIFGDTRVSGPAGTAVAVFGNTYVNSSIGDDAVAVLGDLELGPLAEIDGDVIVVGGALIRDPQAIIHGGIQEIAFGEGLGRFEWLRSWIKHCLLYGRLLAFEPGLGWAWGVALGFLGLYVLIALLFGSSVAKCVETLETQPGQSVLASVLTVLLTPVLMTLLLITVVGIALVPFVGMGLFCAGLFGKAVILGSLGRRVTRLTGIAPLSHIAFAVLVGGIIVLGLYAVPVLGFVAYKLIGILGLGVVVYTLLLAAKARRGNNTPPRPLAPAATPDVVVQPATTVSATAVNEDATPAAGEPASISRAPAVEAGTLPRAGFWIRMAALLIDLILIGIVVSVVEPPGEISLLALAIYGALMWRLRGTTIGGIVCNIQVVRVDGREMNWDTAIVRALSCFLSLAFAGLGFLWIVFDKDRQAWHDKIAGTVVVHAPKGVSLL